MFQTFSPVLAEPPTAPTNLCATNVDAGSVHLLWQAPDTDGGCPLVGYVIEKRQASQADYSPIDRVDSSVNDYTANNLKKDKKYMFRVMAENEAGLLSDGIELSSAIRATSPKVKRGNMDLHGCCYVILSL